MGKVKNKEGSEIRYLQGEVRRLSKVIRHLESQLKSHRRHEHLFEVSQDDKDAVADCEDTIDVSIAIRCEGDEGCFKGVFTEIHIADKIYGKCTTCDRRKRLK